MEFKKYGQFGTLQSIFGIMDHFHLFLTREEQIGDRIEFSIKKDIPIQFVKKLLQAKLPYHPDESTIQIFHNGDLLTDDVMVFSLV